MDGIIIINKPKGCTSHDVVSKVKKMYKEKVGHTGTLDPMATGVLPLLIGKGTLCSKYLINHDKTYKVILELGKKTNTADSEGTIVEEREVVSESLQKEKIEKTLKSFVGKQEQIPPKFSAIKVKGKKLYEYARKGIEVEIKPRQIEIYKINLLNINKNKKQIEFRVSCSKGTYIRSLCEDIASKLGTIGFMAELEREQVGDFTLAQAITLEELEAANNLEDSNKKLKNTNSIITIEKLFRELETIKLQKNEYKLFLNGGRIIEKNKSDGVYKIYFIDKFIGTGIIDKERLKRDIVI